MVLIIRLALPRLNNEWNLMEEKYKVMKLILSIICYTFYLYIWTPMQLLVVAWHNNLEFLL